MLLQAVIATVVKHVMRSIFNADRLTFALHLAFRVAAAKPEGAAGAKALPESEWEHLKKGGGLETSVIRLRGSHHPPKWLPSSLHASFSSLAQAHPHLLASLEQQDSEWADWFQRSEAEHLPVCASHLSMLQKTLLVQALRPDRLHSALASLAMSELALLALAPGTLSMDALQSHAGSTMPILLLATPGGDPSQELREYGVKCDPAAAMHLHHGRLVNQR